MKRRVCGTLGSGLGTFGRLAGLKARGIREGAESIKWAAFCAQPACWGRLYRGNGR
jgi:hypothetical protein